MVKRMKNRYRISLLIIAILISVSMTIGTSYAFWSTTEAQTGTNDIEAGCLKIEINDTNNEGDSTSINLSNTYPMSDARGLSTKPYELTIKNVCNIKADYKIILNVLSASKLTESQIKYHIVKTSPTETDMNPLLISSLESITLEDDTKNKIESTVGKAINNSYIIETGVLNAQVDNVTDSVTYNLRLWIDESVGNDIMNSAFESAISVYAEALE